MNFLNDIQTQVLWFILTIFAVLVLATIVVQLPSLNRSLDSIRELRDRVKTWWVICIIFFLAVLFGQTAATVLLGLVSFLALKEYFSLIPTRRADRNVLFWAYVSIPVQYFWVYIEWYGMFIIFIPVYVFLFLQTRIVFIGNTDGFLRATGTIHWGLITTVFTISHIAYLGVLSNDKTPCGGAGMVLFLVVCTQLNDVAQYMWGKLFGKRKIVPTVSPNKTWAGMIGGVLTISLIGYLLGPIYTPLTSFQALIGGLIIGLSGFTGDVVISAFKRDLGIKDCGSMLPGHGGILDRIDSMTYSAPLYFHYIYYLHF